MYAHESVSYSSFLNTDSCYPHLSTFPQHANAFGDLINCILFRCLREINTGCLLFGKAAPCSSVSIFVPCTYLSIWIKTLNPGDTYLRELNWVSIGAGSGFWIILCEIITWNTGVCRCHFVPYEKVIDMLVQLYFAISKCIIQVASPLRSQYANAQKTIVSRGINLMMQSKYYQQTQSITIWRYAVGVIKAHYFTVIPFLFAIF